MPAEKADATKGAGEAIYKGFAKYNTAVDIINAIETKIAGIESGATGDQTGTEIKVLLEALLTKLSIETGIAETTDKKIMTAAERTKLTGIEASAKDDQTGAEIKALLEALTDKLSIETGVKETTDKKVMTADERTKLTGIETNAKDDQTGAEIKALLEALSGVDRLVASAIQHLDNLGVTPSADQWGALGALVEWTNWTPNLTGGANLSGYDTARYYRIGDICFFHFISGPRNVTSSGIVEFTLPFSVANTDRFIPSAVVNNGVAWIGQPHINIDKNDNVCKVHKTAGATTWAGTETDVEIRVSGFFEIA